MDAPENNRGFEDVRILRFIWRVVLFTHYVGQVAIKTGNLTPTVV